MPSQPTRERFSRWGCLVLAVFSWHLASGTWAGLLITLQNPRNAGTITWGKVQAAISLLFPFGSAPMWQYDWAPGLPTAAFWVSVLLAPPILMTVYLLAVRGRSRADVRPLARLLAAWIVLSVGFVFTKGGLLSPLYLAFQGDVAPSFIESASVTLGRLLAASVYVSIVILWLSPRIAAGVVDLLDSAEPPRESDH